SGAALPLQVKAVQIIELGDPRQAAPPRDFRGDDVRRCRRAEAANGIDSLARDELERRSNRRLDPAAERIRKVAECWREERESSAGEGERGPPPKPALGVVGDTVRHLRHVAVTMTGCRRTGFVGSSQSVL